MREIEKLCCDYIILGLPKKPFRFFWGFFVNKGIRPTVYAEKANFASRFLGLAKFCVSDGLWRDRIALECLERHALYRGARRITLISADVRFSGFIARNIEKLEKLFIIQETYCTGDSK